MASDAEGNVIQYTAGDGSDTVNGFNADDTLQIGDGAGTYSTVKSDGDIIVTVGDGSILLQNAASLESNLNIAGTNRTPDTTPANPLFINVLVDGGADNYTRQVRLVSSTGETYRALK